jgi:hypothetical protein
MGSRPLSFALLVPVVAALGLGACGDNSGPSVRAEPDTTTTAPVDSTTTSTVAIAGDGQVVTFGGLKVTVPTDWPVHDIATEPTTCVRADEHAVYLGTQGPDAACPAQIVGRTETLQLEPLDAGAQIDAGRATQATTLNGLSARVDPDPDTNRALTVVFPDQGVVMIVTYLDSRALAQQILDSVALA